MRNKTLTIVSFLPILILIGLSISSGCSNKKDSVKYEKVKEEKSNKIENHDIRIVIKEDRKETAMIEPLRYKTVKYGGSRTWRTNNPGGIQCSENKLHYNASGRDKSNSKTDKSLCIYSSEELGYIAMIRMIAKNYYKGTIEREFWKYQSDKVNLRNKFREVERVIGIKVSKTRIRDLSKKQLSQFIVIWAKYEGWNARKSTRLIRYENVS